MKNINFELKKGEILGIIGSTGSGKTTLIDLMMGLLEPSQGNLKIDDSILTKENFQAWQKQISHVPQSIFLSDASIRQNIAFSIESAFIDNEKMINASKQAQIFDFIDSLPEKFETKIGENGVKLSGGQRQRIGLARAFYKNSKVIFFDEATSALDSVTENKVMNSINSLDSDITLIIIAHRISTLKVCDRLIRIENGELIEQGSYEYFKNLLEREAQYV